MAVPNVSYKVEIAWTSNWLTPAASRVWTDVSTYVELDQGMTIDYGRTDELSTADANTLSLTLDNKDGRFTWGNAASPYYPNVKIGKPIRVTATVGGVDYVRFTGLVDEWPVEWPGESATFATASITASSRLGRLGLSSPLVNSLDRVMVDIPPDLYWPLWESASPGYEIEGRAEPLRRSLASVEFGIDPSGDDSFECDGRLVVKEAAGSGGGGMGGLTAEFSPAIPFSGNITFGLFVKNLNPRPFTGGNLFFIGFLPEDGTGAVSMAFDRNEYSTHPTELDGVHHLAFTREQTSPTTFTLTNYLDGEVIRTTSGSASPYSSLIRASIGLASDEQTTMFGRFAMWDRVLTSDEIAAVAGAGLAGFRGDTTDERVQRIAAWSGIPLAEVSTTPSRITLAGLPHEGAQAAAVLRDAEAAEGGVLHDDRDGNLVLRPRGDRYYVVSSASIEMSSHLVGGYAPKVDRQGLANIGTGKGPAGDEFFYEDAASRADYGDADYSAETSALDPDEPLQLVAWRINANSEPRPRVPAIQLSVFDFFDFPATVLDFDIGSKISLLNGPVQAPNATQADYFIEGYSEAMGPGTWTLSPNLTPVTLEDSVFTLNNATYGVLDANVLGL